MGCGSFSTIHPWGTHSGGDTVTTEERWPDPSDKPVSYWIETKSKDSILPEEWTSESLIAEQLKDTDVRAMRVYLKNAVVPDDPSLKAWVLARNDEFIIRDGLLFKAEQLKHLGEKTIRLLLVVPKNLRWKVISTCHDSKMYGGHMDASRTCSRIRTYFWWSRIYTDVFDYVKGCLVCRSAAERTAGPAPLTKHSIPSRPFHILGIDL